MIKRKNKGVKSKSVKKKERRQANTSDEALQENQKDLGFGITEDGEHYEICLTLSKRLLKKIRKVWSFIKWLLGHLWLLF